jgi:hypothetical protein
VFVEGYPAIQIMAMVFINNITVILFGATRLIFQHPSIIWALKGELGIFIWVNYLNMYSAPIRIHKFCKQLKKRLVMGYWLIACVLLNITVNLVILIC